MRVHFIAIGGSAMHNLAIALKENGATVTGSDDEIFEPSRSRLAAHGLLPPTEGWNPGIINASLDAIILGMHARKDNPELMRALELGLKVYSYPEYLYEQCKNKRRVVVGGSHGKTTVTSMIMHALRWAGIDYDYMVGAQLEGFDTMVRLSQNAKIAVFEGDEYLSSPIDPRPKFLWYKPHLAVITGVAWDHINVFPNVEMYNKQFKLFVESVESGGYVTWYGGDETLLEIMDQIEGDIDSIPYFSLEHVIEGQSTMVLYDEKSYPVPVFGAHNLQNMAGAMNICMELGMSANDFLSAMSSFKGASRRLQILGQNDHSTVFYDFAHAPSKLKATVSAVKEHFPQRRLTACIELHTFSSLNATFLPQYQDTMMMADNPIVFYSPSVLAHKKMPQITPEQVASAFNIPVTCVVTDADKLRQLLVQKHDESWNLLIMTSGNFGGIDIKKLVDTIL